MTYDNAVSSPHRVELRGRDQLLIAGVEDVGRFDESEIVMTTSEGILVISGENLHIGSLSVEGGELRVDGKIDALHYEEETAPRGGVFHRLFG